MNNNRKYIALMSAMLLSLSIPLSACSKNNNTESYAENFDAEVVATKDTPDVVDTIDIPVEDVSNTVSRVTSSAITKKDTSSSMGNASKAVSSKASSKAESRVTKNNSSKASSVVSTSNRGTQTTIITIPNDEPVHSEVEVYYPPVDEPNSQPIVDEPVIDEPVDEPVVSEPEDVDGPEPEDPVYDSPYVRPFDIEAIRADMIAYGIERGMHYDESVNLDNAGWSSPMGTDGFSTPDYCMERMPGRCREEIDWVVNHTYEMGCVPDDCSFNVIIERWDNPYGRPGDIDYLIYVPYC